MQIKIILTNLLILIISIGLSLGLVEIALRTLPISITNIETKLSTVQDENIGFKKTPNQNIVSKSSCFNSIFSYNIKSNYCS